MSAPRWSGDVHQADWIGPRLVPWNGGTTVAGIVPSGFAAYARILHPIETDEAEKPLVRWADVAAWNGLPLRADAQFHSVALPPAAPAAPPPYEFSVPPDGELPAPDAAVLAGILRGWTGTPEDCWFCLWDGYGGQSDVLPETVRDGPRVEFPHRTYVLYQGPAEAVLALDGEFGAGPNLWWPDDRAWCVASEIDLPWTYVGGSRGLIDAILADGRVEALPAAPDDPVYRVEDWVAAWVDELFDDLLARSEAVLRTHRGTVSARLRRPQGNSHGELRIEVTGPDGGASSSWGVLNGTDDRIRRSVHGSLTRAVLSLTEM